MKWLCAVFTALAFAFGTRAEIANVAIHGVPSVNGLMYGNADIYRVIDGDTRTIIHGDTILPDGFAYTLDLGRDYAISEIRIVPRQDGCCAERLSNFRVSVHAATPTGELGAELWSTNLFTDGTNPGSAAGSLVEIPLPTPQTGRWVQVTALDSPVPDYHLQMTELEVLADVPASEINRATAGVATANQPVWPGTSPANLVNGSRFDYVHGVADLAPGFAYTINLGIEVNISRIIIIPRWDGCCGERLSNYRVTIHKDNGGAPGPAVWTTDLHTDFSDIGALPPATEVLTADLNPAGDFEGQWVRIESLDDPVPQYALQIAEVEVYGTQAEGASILITQDLQDIAVGAGESAALSVSVNVINGETNLVSYQWQRDGVDIAGATNSFFATGPILGADSGKKYRVMVSYPGLPSITSREAVVLVNYARGAEAYSTQVLWTGAGWTIDKLVNGDRFDVFHGDIEIQPGFAYQVRLPAAVKFDRLAIFPRQDGCCPERLSNFRVSIHEDDEGQIGEAVWSHDLYTDGTNPGAANGTVVLLTADMDPNGTFEGRWIQILALEDPIPDYALQMTELEAYGSLVQNLTTLGISQFPTNVLGAPGRSATITVVPNLFNGDPSLLTFQWKKNGAVIAGATNSTLNTGPLSDSDANAKYQVVLSYPGLADVESVEAAVEFDYNYARGARAFSNQPLWIPGGWEISMLVDGNIRPVFHGGEGIAPGFAYTVDLGDVIQLEQINIYPRQDTCCPERFSNLRVSVHSGNNAALGEEVWGADLFTDGSNPGSGEGTIVTVLPDLDPNGTFEGRWIKIESLDNPVPDYALQMTELEAIGRLQAAPRLSIVKTDTGPVITWTEGTLEETAELGQGWTAVANAASPYAVPTNQPRRYYRLRK